MSALIEYTLEIYKADKRVKEGKRLVAKQDFAPSTKDYINTVAEGKRKLGFVVEVFETFVTRKNLMTGKSFQERYDTPYFCSASSESFWSN
jgi:predicted ester cyclase